MKIRAKCVCASIIKRLTKPRGVVEDELTSFRVGLKGDRVENGHSGRADVDLVPEDQRRVVVEAPTVGEYL